MGPDRPGVDAGVVDKLNVPGAGGFRVVPVFEGVFAIPDDVVAVGDVFLDRIRTAALVGEGGIVHFPDPAALHQVVPAGAPELDGVAESHRLAVFPGVLMSAADVGQIAVADDEARGAAPAESMSGAIAEGEAVVNDIVFASLIHDVVAQGQLDAVVDLSGVLFQADKHLLVLGVVVIVVGTFQLVERPAFPAALFSVVEDDVSHIDIEPALLRSIRGHQLAGFQFENGASGKLSPEIEVKTGGVLLRPDLQDDFVVAPFGSDRRSHGAAAGEIRPGRTGSDNANGAHPERLVAAGAEPKQQEPGVARLAPVNRRTPNLDVIATAAGRLALDHEGFPALDFPPVQGDLRSGLVVVTPFRPAQVPDSLSRDPCRLRGGPDVVANFGPIRGIAARFRTQQQRLFSLAVGGISDRPALFAAGRFQRSAPRCAPPETHGVARLQVRPVHALQARPRQCRGFAGIPVVAGFGIDVKNPWVRRIPAHGGLEEKENGGGNSAEGILHGPQPCRECRACPVARMRQRLRGCVNSGGPNGLENRGSCAWVSGWARAQPEGVFQKSDRVRSAPLPC